jgi:hypothetical protein
MNTIAATMAANPIFFILFFMQNLLCGFNVAADKIYTARKGGICSKNLTQRIYFSVVNILHHFYFVPLCLCVSLALQSVSCYTPSMSVTQTVEIPASHRLTIEVPHEVPAGRAILTFTPARSPDTVRLPGGNAHTVEEALQMAAEKLADPNRKPISRHFGILSPNTYGDGVAYQRKIRGEWDD